MGQSYFAIGDPKSGATIQKISTTLQLPTAPDDINGIRAINPALENAVREPRRIAIVPLGHLDALQTSADAAMRLLPIFGIPINRR